MLSVRQIGDEAHGTETRQPSTAPTFDFKWKHPKHFHCRWWMETSACPINMKVAPIYNLWWGKRCRQLSLRECSYRIRVRRKSACREAQFLWFASPILEGVAFSCTLLRPSCPIPTGEEEFRPQFHPLMVRSASPQVALAKDLLMIFWFNQVQSSNLPTNLGLLRWSVAS